MQFDARYSVLGTTIYFCLASPLVFNMPHTRYKVKCALCKKTFDKDSIMVQERLKSFRILACEKDLTDLIDLKDVNMNSGDLRGAKGTMAPGQTLLVAEKGPRA